ncbi:hypothetical protein BCR15_11835 [Tessaracoccus lapidicaptus]|uniref:Uncharacterized protein n=2 Tax=Propionibacteriaceae TaxID=31957 RepID=A0A1C0ART2_9ACTN|nr:hypothetical protein BKM78_07815 [Tessaracoccus sp. T2.5-30]OCL37144.1 hypothetical protein BCR15_11835 [Tessaracoccus lapidicaptus]
MERPAAIVTAAALQDDMRRSEQQVAVWVCGTKGVRLAAWSSFGFGLVSLAALAYPLVLSRTAPRATTAR